MRPAGPASRTALVATAAPGITDLLGVGVEVAGQGSILDVRQLAATLYCGPPRNSPFPPRSPAYAGWLRSLRPAERGAWTGSVARLAVPEVCSRSRRIERPVRKSPVHSETPEGKLQP